MIKYGHHIGATKCIYIMNWTIFISTIYIVISLCERLLLGTIEFSPQILNILLDSALYLIDFCYSNIQGEELDQMTRDILISLLETLRDLVREIVCNYLPPNSELGAELWRLSIAIAAFIWELGGGR